MDSNIIGLLLPTKMDPIVHFLDYLNKLVVVCLYLELSLTNYSPTFNNSISKTISDFAGKGPYNSSPYPK